MLYCEIGQKWSAGKLQQWLGILKEVRRCYLYAEHWLKGEQRSTMRRFLLVQQYVCGLQLDVLTEIVEQLEKAKELILNYCSKYKKDIVKTVIESKLSTIAAEPVEIQISAL